MPRVCYAVHRRDGRNRPTPIPLHRRRRWAQFEHTGFHSRKGPKRRSGVSAASRPERCAKPRPETIRNPPTIVGLCAETGDNPPHALSPQRSMMKNGGEGGMRTLGRRSAADGDRPEVPAISRIGEEASTSGTDHAHPVPRSPTHNQSPRTRKRRYSPKK